MGTDGNKFASPSGSPPSDDGPRHERGKIPPKRSQRRLRTATRSNGGSKVPARNERSPRHCFRRLVKGLLTSDEPSRAESRDPQRGVAGYGLSEREHRRDPVRISSPAGSVWNRSLEPSAGGGGIEAGERSLCLPLSLDARQSEEHHSRRGNRSQARRDRCRARFRDGRQPGARGAGRRSRRRAIRASPSRTRRARRCAGLLRRRLRCSADAAVPCSWVSGRRRLSARP